MSFFRNTIIVTVLNIIGLCLSFMVSIIIFGKYGASYYMDSYAAAIAIPNYISVVLGGALSYVFIPIFIKQKIESNQWSLVNNIISIFIILLGTVTLFGIWFAPGLMRIIAPGFGENQLTYSAELLCLYFPIIIFSCLNELIASIFYSKNIFLIPLVNKLISPLIIILSIFLLPSGLSVKNLIYASLASAFFQLFLLFFTLIRIENYNFKFKINFKDYEVSLLLKLLAPLILSSLVYKLFPIIDSIYLSKLPVGNFSRISYANKLQLVIGALLNSVFSIQVFSLLSKHAAENEFLEIKLKISFFIRTMLFIAIPVAIIILIFGENIIRVLFQRGNFKYNDTLIVSNYLKIYILALPAISIGSIVSNGLYVIPDTKSIMIVGFFESAFYIFICSFIFNHLKAISIPIAYTLNFNISVLILILVLRKRLNNGGGIGILKSCFKTTLLFITIISTILLIVKITKPSDFMIIFYCVFSILANLIIAKLLNFQEVTFIYEKILQLSTKNKKLH